MLSILLTLLIAVLVFALLWWLINLLPVPAGLSALPMILRVVLILAAVIWLVAVFWPGLAPAHLHVN